MALKSLFFISLLTLTSLFADTSSIDTEFRGEAKAKITFLEKQNIELKTKLDGLEDKQKSVEEYKNIIDRQDKRVEDVNAKMSVAGIVVAFLAIIIGIGGVVFPIVLFRQNTKIQEQAKNDIELWKEKTKKEFDNELEKFKEHVNVTKVEMTKNAESLRQIVKEVTASQGMPQLDNNISSEDQELASEESRKLAIKAQRTSSWEDYITSAKLSFFAKNFGDTLRNIDKALEELYKINKKDSSNEVVNASIANTLINRGVTLGQMNKWEEEIKAYDELLHTFKDTSNEAIKVKVAMALYNKSITLGKMNKWEEEIKAYDELLYTFKDTNDETIKVQMAKALFNKGVTLGQMNKGGEAIKVYDELLRTFKDTNDEDIKAQMAMTLFNKGVTLWQMHKGGEAIKVYDELLHTFKDTNDETIKVQIAKALYNKSATLGEMNKRRESIKVYDELLCTFKDTNNEAIKELMAGALVNKDG